MKTEKDVIQMFLVSMAVWPLFLAFIVMFSEHTIFTGQLVKVLLGKNSLSVQEIDGAINAMLSASRIGWMAVWVFFACWLVITSLTFPVFTRMVGEKSNLRRLLVVWASLFLAIGIPTGLYFHAETSELASKVASLREANKKSEH